MTHILSTEPACCNICLEEDKTQFLIWHKNDSPQRDHRSCIDCAARVCFERLKESTPSYRQVKCPDCRFTLILFSERFAKQELLILSYKVAFLFSIYKLMIEPTCSSLSQILLHGPLLFHRKKFCLNLYEDETSAHYKLLKLQLTHLDMTYVVSVLCISAMLVLTLVHIQKKQDLLHVKTHQMLLISLQIGFYYLTNTLMFQNERQFFHQLNQESLEHFCLYPQTSKILLNQQLQGLVAGICLPILFNVLRLSSEKSPDVTSVETIKCSLLEKRISLISLESKKGDQPPL
jgi:hypothetical protein